MSGPAPRRGGMMDMRETRLDNGTRIATATLPHVEAVSFGVWVDVGSRYEAVRLGGVSHFIEHLLFKGTRRRTARDISQAIEGRGGYLNAFTQEEHTCYYTRGTYDWIEESVDVLTDMYMHPRFDSAEIEKERGVIVEEIMMYRDQPQHVVHEMLTAALWQRHPLGRPVIGSVKTLAGMRRKDIVDFKAAHYRPANTLFTFAGRVEHERAVELVRRLAGARRPAARRGCRKVAAQVPQRAIWVERRPIEQTQLALGCRIFGYRDARRYTLKVLNVILGENMSSRLFQVVREQRGLAYSIHSSAHLLRDTGALVISGGLDRRRTKAAVDLIAREIARLKSKPVTGPELDRARDYVTGQIRMSLESSSNQMMWLGNTLLAHGRFITPEEVIRKIRRVTPEAIQRLARQCFRADRMSLCLISPDVKPTDEARYAASLKRL